MNTREYPEIRQSVRAALSELGMEQDRVGFDSAPTWQLHERLAGEYCRLAVLGEFSRGKSTLINALLGMPDLLPSSRRPCTSALIEIVAAEGSTTYAYRESLEEIGLVSSDREAFLRNASVASLEAAETVSMASTKFWRITLENRWLDRLGMAIVDTPGLNEDIERTRLAVAEAQRADAALLVVSVDQPFTAVEQAILSELSDQSENLYMVANRADLVDESEWEDVRNHLLDRIYKRLPAFNSRHLFFISAKRANVGPHAGGQDCWQVLFESFRMSVECHLASRSGVIFGNRLIKDVRRLHESVSKVCLGACETTLLRRAKQILGWQGEYDDVERDSKLVIAYLKMDFERERWAFGRALVAALPDIFERVWQREGKSWVSDEWIVINPRAYVSEVASKAKASLDRGIEQWLKQEGSEQIANVISNAFSVVSRNYPDFIRYISQDGSGDDSRLLVGVMANVFGKRFQDHDLPVGELIVAMGLAAVIGYIISDVVLFYIAGIVAGFLNPFIIAGAVLAGIVGYFTVGSDWVAGKVRQNVYEKIKEKLEDGNVTYPLVNATANAVEGIFNPLVDDLVERVNFQLAEHRQQIYAAIADLRQANELAKTGVDVNNLHDYVRRLDERIRDRKAVQAAADKLMAIIDVAGAMEDDSSQVTVVV